MSIHASQPFIYLFFLALTIFDVGTSLSFRYILEIKPMHALGNFHACISDLEAHVTSRAKKNKKKTPDRLFPNIKKRNL